MTILKNKIMKHIIYILLSLGLIFVSCTDMNEISKDFLVPETRYAGSPDTIKVFSGRERVILNFQLTDMSIVSMDVYWNNRSDSMILPVEMDEAPKKFNIEIGDLAEGAYSFEIITHDDKGNTSIVSRATGKVFGEAYQNSLLDTPLRAYIDGGITSKIEAIWGSPDLTALRMELLYTNVSDKEITVVVEVPQSEDELYLFQDTLRISEYKSGTALRYRTFYLPEKTAIDTFCTPFKEVSVRGTAIEYERTLWTIEGDYDIPTNRYPQNLLDGDPSTHWHMTKVDSKRYPHSVFVDMGIINRVSGFFVQHRPGSPPITPAKTIAFKVSEDGIKWTSVGEFMMNKESNQKQYFDLTLDVECRFFEFIVKSDYSNGPSTGLAELGAYYR